MRELSVDRQAAAVSSPPPKVKTCQKLTEEPKGPPERLQFEFCVAQKQDEGEDAEPLLLRSDFEEVGIIGVFDGMGGSGGTQYLEDGIKRTGAYIAARLVREMTSDFFRCPRKPSRGDNRLDAEQTANSLAASLLKGLQQKMSQLEPAATGARLAGKMMRRLPTTLACLSYRVDAGEFRYQTFWAGDSRVYFLSPEDGLQQISSDDLRSGADALENLLEDSPVSNFVNADGPFKLNTAVGRCDSPAIFLVATDGCFSYCSSPAHFEHSILSALQSAGSIDVWRDDLRMRLERLAGDDLSMALIASGWRSFASMKAAFEARLAELSKTYIDPLDDLDSQVNRAIEEQKQLVNARNELRRSLWTRYRASYEAFRKRTGEENQA